MAKFKISARSNGEFQFSLVADNGRTILSSEGYSTKAGCMNGVESVKTNSQDEKRYEMLVAKNGKFYFNLKASNGQVIASSEMYETEESRKGGMDSVMKNAANAEVDETTLS